MNETPHSKANTGTFVILKAIPPLHLITSHRTLSRWLEGSLFSSNYPPSRVAAISHAETLLRRDPAERTTV